MTKHASNGLEPSVRLCQGAEGSKPLFRRFYPDLCKLENLQRGYAQIRKNAERLGVDPLTLEAIEGEGVVAFLEQVSNDLQTQTCKPEASSEDFPGKDVVGYRSLIAFRNQVVLSTLKILVDRVLPSEPRCDKDPAKAITWLRGTIEKGLTRIYTVNLEECFDVRHHARLLETLHQRLGDPEITALLGQTLRGLSRQAIPQQKGILHLLADLAFDGIDRVLQQATAIGREGSVVHLRCARFATELVILADHDPRYDWIIPGAKKRVREGT